MTQNQINQSNDYGFGFSRFQTAFWISMFAASAQYSIFLIPGLISREWEGEMGGYFLFPAIFIFITMIVCGSILWLFGFKMLRLVSWLIYSIFGRKIVSYESWDKVFCSSLWTLPWAFGIGAIVYVLYFTLHWGGSPDDIIVGTIGNLLGAFCYGTLFCNWYQLIRDAPAFRNEEE